MNTAPGSVDCCSKALPAQAGELVVSKVGEWTQAQTANPAALKVTPNQRGEFCLLALHMLYGHGLAAFVQDGACWCGSNVTPINQV